MFREARVQAPSIADGWVAFTVEGRTRQSPSDIYFVKDGVEERRLTGSDLDGGRAVCPQFSPDGSRFAYTEGPSDVVDDTGVAVVITRLDADGRPVGPTVRHPVESWGGVCPTWSPDSRSVAFLAAGPILWTLQVDGTATRIGGWGQAGDVSVIDWSPDGLAVAATERSGTGIWIMPVDGGEAHFVEPSAPGVTFGTGVGDEGARWSPDTTHIAVIEEREAGHSLRIVDVTGAEPPVGLEGGVVFAWSPDGNRIAYVRSVDQPGDDVNELVVATATGVGARVIATDPRGISGLTWAPDGSAILYAADRGESGQLMVVSADGGSDPVALTRHGHLLEYTSSNDLSWQGVAPWHGVAIRRAGSLAVLAFVAACCAGQGSASIVVPSAAPPSSLPRLVEGSVSAGRYVLMPSATGWIECQPGLECPSVPPHVRTMTIEITVPDGWQALNEGTVLAPSTPGSGVAPADAGLVIGWTGPGAGLHSDPCLPVAHKTPDIAVGPTVDDFVGAVLAHPALDVSGLEDTRLGGYGVDVHADDADGDRRLRQLATVGTGDLRAGPGQPLGHLGRRCRRLADDRPRRVLRRHVLG